ncbi:hypothetical protein LTR62_007982 [Meristemomyces frigidus]|uniref:PHD-type domain-containing protein n=1 Tax=Meristemomyces frigidus TaxID=1508187 RepID=A0AAN7TPT7_9PEZI|nr:hypothetical protein LTR62_007982 [Meristemomyces frigidus]
MDFEQQFPGNGDWNFPSPHATPSHAFASNNAFQTPKTATFPSHFQDAFTTPQMPSYPTPQQLQHSSMTPVQRPQSSSETLRSNFYAIQTSGVQAVPMLQHISYAPQATRPGSGIAYQPSPIQPVMQQHMIASSQQMQTPPPTRGTPGRKVLQPATIAFGTPSTIASRRFATPQHELQAQAPPQGPYAPMQYPQLQFSPDLYQFNNLGPASAPVMPQTQLFWEQTRSPMSGMPPPAPLDDPFAPIMQQSVTWSTASPAMSQGPIMSFETPAMASFPVRLPHHRAASATSPPAAFVNNAMPVAASAASLDPSLIYSSPVRPISRSASRTSRLRPEKLPTKRKDSAQKDSASPTESGTAMTGPSLRRSNTLGNPRPGTAQSAMSISDSLSRSDSMHHITRTASPLKRAGRTPLRAITEHKPTQRPSVILTVDENGIARTETRRADPSPTKSIRERYPGLFDSDTSDDDDNESDTSEQQPPSRSTSFNFARNEERRAKAARLDPPVENLEGLSIPRSSSALSVKGVTPSRAAVAAAAQLRRKGSLRRTSRQTAGKRNNGMTSSTGSLIDSCPMDMSMESNNPEYTSTGADFQAVPLTWPPSGSLLRPRDAALDAHNRRWSMMSFDQHLPPPPPHSGQTRATAPPTLIRCVCSRTEDDGSQLLQCSSCTQWLHTACVGLDSFRVPSPPLKGFVCFLCVKPAAGFR